MKEYLLFALWFSVHEIYYFGDLVMTDQYKDILFEHDWFDVKVEDYEKMLEYSNVTYEEYSSDQKKRLLSVVQYYNVYYNRL